MKIQSATSPETEALIRDFLSTQHSGTLATASRSGDPHAAVVYFSLDDELCLLFATKTETQKYKNIEENKQVAFAVYDEESQTTIQITGSVEIIKDEDQHQKVIANMFTYSSALSRREFPPAEKLLAGDYVALRLVPQVIKMAVYARPDSEGDDLYETLLLSGE